MDFLKLHGVVINTSNDTLNCAEEMTHSGSNEGADAPAVENTTNELSNAVFGLEIKPDWTLKRLLHRNFELFDWEFIKPVVGYKWFVDGSRSLKSLFPGRILFQVKYFGICSYL